MDRTTKSFLGKPIFHRHPKNHKTILQHLPPITTPNFPKMRFLSSIGLPMFETPESEAHLKPLAFPARKPNQRLFRKLQRLVSY